MSVMPSQPWDDDEVLLTDLARALREAEEVPQEFLDAGRAAFALRTLEHDLATLTYDSTLDDDLLVRARSGQSARNLVFQATGLSVEIEVTGEGITGQLVPPSSGHVGLYTTGGLVAETDTDELGCFVLEAPPRGPIRLRCNTDEATVVTEWICV